MTRSITNFPVQDGWEEYLCDLEGHGGLWEKPSVSPGKETSHPEP